MPVAPPPKIYRCSACGWSKTVAPRSDALMPGEFFRVCPSCGHVPLDEQAAGAFRAGVARVLFRLQHLK